LSDILSQQCKANTKSDGNFLPLVAKPVRWLKEFEKFLFLFWEGEKQVKVRGILR
jgi:hypothetical protein